MSQVEKISATNYLYGQFIGIFANLVKNYHGIIERLHFIAQKQTELQNELYDE